MSSKADRCLLQVHVWDATQLDSQQLDPRASLEPYEGQAVGSVTWVSSIDSSAAWLLTGDAVNRELRLYQGSASSGVQLKQALRLESLEGEHAFFNHLVYNEVANVIVLANARRKAVYTVHLGMAQEGNLRFDYLARFSVSYPILSVTALQTVPGSSAEPIQLYCVQTEAIQQYTVHPSMCKPSAVTAAAPALQHRVSTASSIPAVSGTPSLPNVSGTATAPRSLEAANSDVAAQAAEDSAISQMQQQAAAALGSAASERAASEAAAPRAAEEGQSPLTGTRSISLPLPPPPVTTPPAAAVPQPRLLTPKQLIKLAGSRTASMGSSTSTDHYHHMASPYESSPPSALHQHALPSALSPRPSNIPSPTPSPAPAASSIAARVDADTPASTVALSEPSASPSTQAAGMPDHSSAAAVNGTAQGGPKILKRRQEDDVQVAESLPTDKEVCNPLSTLKFCY